MPDPVFAVAVIDRTNTEFPLQLWGFHSSLVLATSTAFRAALACRSGDIAPPVAVVEYTILEPHGIARERTYTSRTVIDCAFGWTEKDTDRLDDVIGLKPAPCEACGGTGWKTESAPHWFHDCGPMLFVTCCQACRKYLTPEAAAEAYQQETGRDRAPVFRVD